MTTRPLLLAIAVVSAACSTDTATEQQDTPSQAHMEAPRATGVSSPATAVPANPGDRAIRRELNLAIDGDADLKDREISFIVSNGDVSVSGTVRSEAERKRINDLAMGIPGVKSVANALRVSQ